MTVFLSYSRRDEQIALQLATELRSLGVPLWIDQLDLVPGVAWDDSVMAALKRSESFLVLLSKDSVGSPNVLDEISYALDQRKQIVPVLLEACEKPLRLHRLQHVDLTSDFATGVAKIQEALGSSAGGAADSPEPPAPMKSVPQRSSTSPNRPIAPDAGQKVTARAKAKPRAAKNEAPPRVSTPVQVVKYPYDRAPDAIPELASPKRPQSFLIDCSVALTFGLGAGAFFWYKVNITAGAIALFAMAVFILFGLAAQDGRISGTSFLLVSVAVAAAAVAGAYFVGLI
jgi:hypothetical protein